MDKSLYISVNVKPASWAENSMIQSKFPLECGCLVKLFEALTLLWYSLLDRAVVGCPEMECETPTVGKRQMLRRWRHFAGFSFENANRVAARATLVSIPQIISLLYV